MMTCTLCGEYVTDDKFEGHRCGYDGVIAQGKASAVLPTDSAERKKLPLCTGVLDYFPDALIAVAEVSRVGNEQHNPGEPLHWARGKSMDQADTILRHMVERGRIDSDGVRHSAKVAWRALAQLQLEIEASRITTPAKDIRDGNL